MGLLAAPWLDRVNRKPALLVLLTLRFLLLMACALVQDSQQLLVIFILSGCVAGPLAAILMAAVLDLVPRPNGAAASPTWGWRFHLPPS